MSHNVLVQTKYMLCISGDDYFQKGNIYDLGTVVDKVARKGNYEHGLRGFYFECDTDYVDYMQKNHCPLFVEADRLVTVSVDTDQYADIMVQVNARIFNGEVFER